MNTLSQRSPYAQIGIGAAGGFLTGYVFLRASKLVAMAAGGTILAIQLALQTGVLELEVLEVEHQPGQRQLQVSGQGHQEANIEQLRETARKACASSRRMCVAFLGGFLLGFGWA